MFDNQAVDYRYLNMDNECFTTAGKLMKYATDFPGGTHRVVAVGSFVRDPVLQAYGRKPFHPDDMVALYSRLLHQEKV